MSTLPAIEQLGISRAAMAARGLREYEEATVLELVEIGEDGREFRLVPPAAAAWRNLKAAAREDGIAVYLASAFRSVARQVEIIQTKLAARMPIEEILTLCAAPGYSEHHTGRAIDIATPAHLSWKSNSSRRQRFSGSPFTRRALVSHSPIREAMRPATCTSLGIGAFMTNCLNSPVAG